MELNVLRLSTRILFEKEVYGVAFLNFLSIAERSNSAIDWFYAGYSLLPFAGFAKALEMFDKCHSLDSNINSNEVMLALLRASSPINEDRDGLAAVEIMQSVEVKGVVKPWSFYTVYAAAYAELGDFENALKQLEVALRVCASKYKVLVLQRIEQYVNGIPFRLNREHILEQLRGFGKCKVCNGNVSISRSDFCVECLLNSRKE